MLNIVLLTLILLCNSVAAVFDDEAYQVDWHKDNLGEVLSVERVEDKFLILSETFNNKSLITWLSVDTGKSVARIPLDMNAKFFEVVDDKIFLDNGKIYDARHGFELPTSSDTEFVPSFKGPNLKQVEFKDSTLFFHAPLGENSKEFHLPVKFKDIKYFRANDNLVELLISTTDKHYIFYKSTGATLETIWSRDESLFDIVAYTFLDEVDQDLTVINAEVKHEEKLPLLNAYGYRVRKNLNRLLDELLSKKFNLGKIIAEYLSDTDISAIIKKELQFGFTKELLLATSMGSIVSLDIRTGSELWRTETHLTDITSIKFINERDLRIITPTIIAVLHTHTSELILEIEKSVSAYESMSALSKSSDILIKNDLDHNLSLLGNSTEDTTYFISSDNKHVQGYHLHDSMLIPTWMLEAQENESILSLSMKDSESAANLGVILGNRTVLYKYLNPNIAAYLVSNTADKSLTINIIETITGELLFSRTHDELVDFTSPINIAVGEYWVVYSYFSRKPVPEQKLVVAELYESLKPDNRVSVSGGCHDSLSSELKPEVVIKSYLFPQVVEHLTISKTKFGITTTAIVLQLDDGSVTYIPKYLLSARRVEESRMSDTDKQEFMASPYDPVIPINDHFVITHSRSVLPSEHTFLFSIPTNLESTSIICSIGHDMFCTRISPSSQFDKLSTTFEKGNLGITIICLLILCYFLRPMVTQRKLKTKWLVKDIDISSL